jgi:hypothetical protein
MTIGWMPTAIDGTIAYPDLRGGLSYMGGTERRHKNPILTLHTTEGYSPTGGRNTYHFTVGQDPDDGAWDTRQWRSVEMGAWSLRDRESHESFHLDVETNRCGDPHIQVAIAWRASQIETLPDEAYQAVAEIVAWAHEEYGLEVIPMPGTEGGYNHGGYGYEGAQRISADEWLAGRGIGAHRFVPENTHWDPGAFDIAKLIEFSHALIGERMETPVVFEVGVPNALWEPYALKCYFFETGEVFDPVESSAVAASILDQVDIITPSQKSMDIIWQQMPWGNTHRSVFYSHGKEANKFEYEYVKAVAASVVVLPVFEVETVEVVRSVT